MSLKDGRIVFPNKCYTAIKLNLFHVKASHKTSTWLKFDNKSHKYNLDLNQTLVN